jgi:LPXTG-site transpeptidase (sortase) family protein
MARKKNYPKRRTLSVKYFLNLILAFGLIAAGVSLVFWATYLQGWDIAPQSQNQAASQTSSQKPIEKPAKIYIAKMQKTLDISDGYVQNNRWVISKTGVSYLTTSGSLGQVGNVVLYGHNTLSVLGGLWKVQNWDFVEVTAADGKVFKYQIFERKEVKPNAVEILNQTQDARLTIYTCSGFLDTARFVVVGKLVS